MTKAGFRIGNLQAWNAGGSGPSTVSPLQGNSLAPFPGGKNPAGLPGNGPHGLTSGRPGAAAGPVWTRGLRVSLPGPPEAQRGGGREAESLLETQGLDPARGMRKRSRRPGTLCKSPARGFPPARVRGQEAPAHFQGRMSASTAADWRGPGAPEGAERAGLAVPLRVPRHGGFSKHRTSEGSVPRLPGVPGFHPGAVPPGLLRFQGLRQTCFGG